MYAIKEMVILKYLPPSDNIFLPRMENSAIRAANMV